MLILALLTLIAVETVESSRHHVNNSSYESPPYYLDKVFEGFERRVYFGDTRWVCCAEEPAAKSPHEAERAAFWKLFRYFGGENDQGLRIPMTVPRNVLTTEEGRRTMCLYLGKKFVTEPAPIPTDPYLFLETRPETKVYTRVTTGPMDAKRFQQEMEALATLVQETLGPGDDPADFTRYYANAYGSRSKLFGQRSEVWIPVGKPSASGEEER